VKAATYIRVSTEEQADSGTSLDTQRERTRAFIESQGWDFVEEFADEGVSGAKASRPSLDRLMTACRDGDVEAIVVTKLDRFTRSSRHLENALGDLDALGVAFVSLSESIDSSTASGRMFRTMLGAFASFEREQIAERMGQGKRAIQRQGFWTGGSLPFGFQAIPDGSHKRLVVDDFNAETVRIAASLLIDQGCSLYETAERLNALDRPPAKADRWDNILLRHMLKREHLAPEILDRERWDQVQALIKATSIKRRPRDQTYPLSLRIYATCGAQFHGVFRRELSNRFYSCNNKKWENRHQRCDDQSIRADDIEHVVWEQVCDLLSKPERLVALAEEYLGLRGNQIEVERDEYEETQKKVAALDKAIQNVLLTSAKAGLEPKDIEDAAKPLTGERDALKRHLAMIEAWRADSAQASQRMRRLWELAEEAHKRLPMMTPEEQKQVLELLDVRVTVLEHARKSPGGRVLEPARIRIEGFVSDDVLSAASAARHMNDVVLRRSSSPWRASASSLRRSRGRR
jgi:DNA invertase Pin-like site-specific DNA recombinase